MSDGASPVNPPSAAAAWRERHPRLVTAARTFAAAWCGAFAASAAVLTLPLSIEDWQNCAIPFLASAVFSFIAAAGICRWREALPRYGFAAASIAVLLLTPAEWRFRLSLGLALPLFVWLLFVCRWRGARWAVLFLAVIWLALPERQLRYDVPLPESAYLPISLLAGEKRVRLLAVGEELMPDWWRQTKYVIPAVDGPADVAVAGGGTSSMLLSWLDNYEMISRGDLYRRGVYRYLTGRLAPGGVLVMPRCELSLLPEGGWHFAPLPGAADSWLAARRGTPPVTDPEVLDKRLQNFQERVEGDWFLLPPGAFSALYYAPRVQPVYFEAVPERGLPFGRWWYWLAAWALVYFCIRLPFCLRENRSTMVAAGENALALTLFTLGAVRTVGEAEFLTGLSPQLLFCTFGIFLLPVRPGKWGTRLLNVSGMAALLAPLAFPGSAAVLWGCWLVAALSGAALREGLHAESPRLSYLGSCFGAAAGVAVYAALVIFHADTLAAAAAICAVFRCGVLLRHWRG